MANGEELIPITLNFGDYEDVFEWDITNPDNSPEDFAYVTCRDLGLSQDLFMAISYEIRR